MDKFDILANFDIENNLSDCTTDENLSDISLSDTSSENGNFEECNINDTISKTQGFENIENLDKPSEVTNISKDAETTQDDETESVKSLKPLDKVSSLQSLHQEVQGTVGNKVEPLEESQEEDNDDLKTPLANSPLNSPKKLSRLDYEGSIHLSDLGSIDYQNDEFGRMEQTVTNYEHQLSLSPSKPFDSKIFHQGVTPQNSARSDLSNAKSEITQDDQRFQNLQDEINLLNILMHEAENQTEKCGSLYNSFTNEINNSLTYGKSKADDCGNSLASFVDGSKFDVISVKSELLFSDYGKSESNYDGQESQRKKSEQCFNEDDTKSGSSIVEKISVSSVKSNRLKECPTEKLNSKTENISDIPVEDKVVLLWNQIMRLKCSLKNLQLNLKEKQIETLMQINEFLLHQNQSNSHPVSRNTSSTGLYKRSEQNIPNKLSESFVFTKNNRVKEDIALNNLKIALIECNMLSSTASSLVNSLPDYEQSNSTTNPSSKRAESIVSKCCCNKLRMYALCSCPTQTNISVSSEYQKQLKSDKPIEDLSRMKRRSLNVKIDEERKVKSNEEITYKYPETKYCLSDLCLEELSPRACM